MASPIEELIEQKILNLETVPDFFVERTSATSVRILNEVLQILSQMEVQDGMIIPSNRNYSLILQVNEKIKEVFSGEQYLTAVESYALSFIEQRQINDRMMKAIFGNAFSPQDRYLQTVLNTQRNAVELITGDALFQNYATQLNQILNNSISTSVSFNEAIRQLSGYIVGDSETVAKLQSYSRQVVTDAFSIADRNYTQIISDELGVEWFYYAGGRIKDSREFCVCRSNKYYHRKEVEDWGKTNYQGCGTTSAGTWKGRIPDTNQRTIFSFAGGYNCRHSIIPTTEDEVPANVKARVRAEGYID